MHKKSSKEPEYSLDLDEELRRRLQVAGDADGDGTGGLDLLPVILEAAAVEVALGEEHHEGVALQVEREADLLDLNGVKER